MTDAVLKVLPSLATSSAPLDEATLGKLQSGEIGTISEPAEASFGDVMARTIEEAALRDRVAGQKVEALAAGTSDDLHGTMIALKEAEISVKLVGSIRNKLLDAFHELWRTSV